MTEPRPRLLLTNDDGIGSPGLRRLAERLAGRHDLVVVAPSGERSGSGTGIGAFDPERGVELESAHFGGVEAYAIDGPPGLAAMAAALGAFGPKPDLVVSGVNAGMNVGHSVLHSGTVGAALTARTFGIAGLALSLAPSDPWRWDTAVDVAASAVEWMLANGRNDLVLNVNVPGLPIDEVRGARWAPLDRFGYFHLANARDDRLQFDVRSADAGRNADCDTALCLAGFVTLTPLSSVEPVPFPGSAPEDVWPGSE